MSFSKDLYNSFQEAEYTQSEEYQLRASLLPIPQATVKTTDKPTTNG